MKIYNYGNDYALADKLSKKPNADNQIKETAVPTVEHQEAPEAASAPKDTSKTNKKKKA